MSKTRTKRSITIRPDLLDWLKKGVDKGAFRTISHGIEKALLDLKEKERRR